MSSLDQLCAQMSSLSLDEIQKPLDVLSLTGTYMYPVEAAQVRKPLDELLIELTDLFQKKIATESTIEKAQDRCFRKLEKLGCGKYPVERAYLLSHEPKIVEQARKDGCNHLDVLKLAPITLHPEDATLLMKTPSVLDKKIS